MRTRRRTREEAWSSRPLRLQPLRRGTLGPQLADEIRRAIVLGKVAAGERLESCRTLARELGVSVGVVREAIAELKGEGLVSVMPGVGVFVRRRARAAPKIRASRRRATRRELEEVLQVVDPLLADAAARHSELPQLADLRMLLWERQRASTTEDARTFADADATFHRLIAHASGNALAASARHMAAVALHPHLAARSAALAANRHLNQLHETLVNAIEDGRPSRARRAARLICAIEAKPP